MPSRRVSRRGAHVAGERYVVDLLRHTPGPDGSMTCGTGNATLLPGQNIQAALDTASLMAGLVHNPLHTIPAPAEIPGVALADAALQADPAAALDDAYGRLKAAAATHPAIQLTAAEFFAEEETTRLCNSRGIDADAGAQRRCRPNGSSSPATASARSRHLPS